MSLRAILDRLDEAAQDGADLVQQDAPGWVAAVEAGVRAPLVKASVLTLGGADRPSLYVMLTLDKKEDWPYGIVDNSRFAKFMIHAVAQPKIELLTMGPRMPKFRKRPYRGVADAIQQINAYLKQAAEA
jgi:hypothetical protein